MVRAATTGGDGIPSVRALRRFFSSSEWVDLHQLAKDQLVTQGPLGLKVLAGIAGFSWRDEDPSGEASIGWYEEATRDGSSAARERLLTYNEDDVLATRALRHWLDGPARSLPHVRSIGGHA
jgi:predicted RecB family nuclease